MGNNMAFDLRQLKAFEAVARHGGFSRASREIGLTQPTLSTHIRNLETSLGVRLFDRGTRTVNLTPTGAVLADYARKMLQLYEESLQAMEAFTGQIRGTIHVDASTVPGEYILPRWLVDFHRRYTEVQVTLTVSDSAAVLGKVERGESALGLTGSAGNDPALENTLLCEDEVVLVAAGPISRDAGPVLDLGRLPGIPLIRREYGSGTQLAIETALQQHGIDPESLNWIATLGSTRAVIEGALAGLGGAFLSYSVVSREIADGTLEEIPLGEMEIRRGLYVVYNRHRTLSPVASCLLKELIQSRHLFERKIKRS